MAEESSGKAQMLSTKELLCLPIDDVLAKLSTPQTGLTSKEAGERPGIYGYNEVAKRRRRSAMMGFLLHFKNPLVLMLLLAGIISGLFGDLADIIHEDLAQ